MLSTLLIKEFRLILRDYHALLVLFFMPIVFVLIVSFSLQSVFSSKDSANRSLQLMTVFADNIDPKTRQHFSTLANATIESVSNDIDVIKAAKKTTLAGDTSAVIVFNQVSKKIAIDIYYAPNTPDYSRALIEAYLLLKLSNKQSSKVPSPLTVYELANTTTNKKPSSVQQSVPAWLIFAMFFIIIPLSSTLLIELNNGTLERLNTFAIAKTWILLGKLLPYMLVNLIQACLMFATGLFLVPALGGEALVLGANAWLLLPVSIALSLTAISFALLIAIIVRTHEQASSIGGVSNLLMGAIGGVMVPVFVMPKTMQTLAEFSPMNWGLNAFLEILLRQGDFYSVLPHMLKLVGLAIFLFLLTYWQLQKTLIT
ncbi:ABC transporter permease [Bathymodiolus septemdierum thioautotrophic gill symbiont]|uniref:Antibiotic transport system permease n=1 Tax=endosymbiont of Bathymodiolus septemdierum str. Myojin knoll TaxID=1303921 RepID=A0A0N7KBL3_9GAMM|nr:ABC transporter permease [Bathymodiolus septemdierum thioautotrophic gill symbiont]BAS68335.1 antibiotic transport system permease [endosymbiont of Bathymodiolus septemdierum str. Myojin knoll]